MEKALHERFGVVLDVILEHLKHGRKREAAEVINALPDAQVRNFAFFLCMHVESDLDQLGREVRNHTAEIMARDMPSPN
jgi:hypothetical protein